MLFNSLQFMVFLPTVLLAYYLTPKTKRWIVLLIASYYFYMSWNASYAILLFGSTIVTYTCGIKLYETKNPRAKKWWLGFGIFFNMALLFTFKYFNFVSASITNVMHILAIPLDPIVINVLLPVGISFYSFQAVSYLLDVSHGKLAPQYHFGIFAVYKSFFPQLVAGPIERAPHMMPQLNNMRDATSPEVAEGLKLLVWGFFKKLVVADRIALYIVNPIFNAPGNATALQIIVAVCMFSYQVYCDFSGYTDIARGCAKLMGFDLVQNFRRPFSSKSIAEYWRRWHISLSSWFQDYVFNPFYLKIFAKLPKKIKTATKHWTAFIISIIIGEIGLGLWHGANWTFAAYGLYHGIMIIVYYAIKRWWDPMYAWIRVTLTFLIVCGSSLFFRANSIADVGTMISRVFSHTASWSYGTIPLFDTALILILIVVIEVLQYFWKEGTVLAVPGLDQTKLKSQTKKYLELSFVGIFFFIILICGIFAATTFIYFQF